MTEEQMAQPITIEFLKKNFADYSENNNVYSTTREQSPRCVDVFPNFGKFTISVFDETMDNGGFEFKDISAAFATGEKRSMQVELVGVHHTAGNPYTKIGMITFRLFRISVLYRQ